MASRGSSPVSWLCFFVSFSVSFSDTKFLLFLVVATFCAVVGLVFVMLAAFNAALRFRDCFLILKHISPCPFACIARKLI